MTEAAGSCGFRDQRSVCGEPAVDRVELSVGGGAAHQVQMCEKHLTWASRMYAEGQPQEGTKPAKAKA